MQCTNCGQTIPEEAKVCGHCGHRLKDAFSSKPSQPPTVSSQPPASAQGVQRNKTPGWLWAILAGLVVLVGGVVVLYFSFFFGSRMDQKQIDANPGMANPLPAEIQPAAIPTQKEEATMASNVLEPYQAGGSAAMLSDLAKETGPGTWAANISSTTPVQLKWGWCTASEQILEQNLSRMKINFYIDGGDVTDAMAQSTEPIEGGVCRIYRGIIRTWSAGQHAIMYKMVFLEKVNDGEADFEGENKKTYTVNVRP